MTTFLDKLNLRPQEQRLVVIVGIILFVVLNLWLVWPHFGDLGRLRQRKRDAEVKLRRYQEELKKEAEYKKELNRLQAMGNYVASDQQALELMREVQAQASTTGVGVQRWEPVRTSAPRTNSFFEEASLTISVNTGEKELVDFLYNLSSQGSLTRVRTLSLRRDPSQMRLAGEITFTKSFQRKPPAAPVAAAPKTTNSPTKVASVTTKPATNAPAKTAAAPAKAAGSPAKPAPAQKPAGGTNTVAGAKKADHGTNTTSPNFLKRLFSKWF